MKKSKLTLPNVDTGQGKPPVHSTRAFVTQGNRSTRSRLEHSFDTSNSYYGFDNSVMSGKSSVRSKPNEVKLRIDQWLDKQEIDLQMWNEDHTFEGASKRLQVYIEYMEQIVQCMNDQVGLKRGIEGAYRMFDLACEAHYEELKIAETAVSTQKVEQEESDKRSNTVFVQTLTAKELDEELYEQIEKDFTATMEFDDVSKILAKVQSAEESECFDELRRLYLRMNPGEEVWENDKFEPAIDGTQFQDQCRQVVERVHAETKRTILLHLKKFSKHASNQTESSFVDQNEHDKLNAEYRRLLKQLEVLNDNIENKDREIAMAENQRERVHEAYLAAESEKQIELVRANAAEREVKEMIEQVNVHKRNAANLGKEVVNVWNERGEIQEKLDNAHRRIRIITVNWDSMIVKYDALEARMSTYLKGDERRKDNFTNEREKFIKEAAEERERLIREKEAAVREMKKKPKVIIQEVQVAAPVQPNLLSPPKSRLSSPQKSNSSASPQPVSPDYIDSEASSDWNDDEDESEEEEQEEEVAPVVQEQSKSPKKQPPKAKPAAAPPRKVSPPKQSSLPPQKSPSPPRKSSPPPRKASPPKKEEALPQKAPSPPRARKPAVDQPKEEEKQVKKAPAKKKPMKSPFAKAQAAKAKAQEEPPQPEVIHEEVEEQDPKSPTLTIPVDEPETPVEIVEPATATKLGSPVPKPKQNAIAVPRSLIAKSREGKRPPSNQPPPEEPQVKAPRQPPQFPTENYVRQPKTPRAQPPPASTPRNQLAPPTPAYEAPPDLPEPVQMPTGPPLQFYTDPPPEDPRQRQAPQSTQSSLYKSPPQQYQEPQTPQEPPQLPPIQTPKQQPPNYPPRFEAETPAQYTQPPTPTRHYSEPPNQKFFAQQGPPHQFSPAVPNSYAPPPPPQQPANTQHDPAPVQQAETPQQHQPQMVHRRQMSDVPQQFTPVQAPPRNLSESPPKHHQQRMPSQHQMETQTRAQQEAPRRSMATQMTRKETVIPNQYEDKVEVKPWPHTESYDSQQFDHLPDSHRQLAEYNSQTISHDNHPPPDYVRPRQLPPLMDYRDAESHEDQSEHSGGNDVRTHDVNLSPRASEDENSPLQSPRSSQRVATMYQDPENVGGTFTVIEQTISSEEEEEEWKHLQKDLYTPYAAAAKQQAAAAAEQQRQYEQQQYVQQMPVVNERDERELIDQLRYAYNDDFINQAKVVNVRANSKCVQYNWRFPDEDSEMSGKPVKMNRICSRVHMGSPLRHTNEGRGNRINYLPICTSPIHRIPQRMDGVMLDSKQTHLRSLIPSMALENWSHKASEQAAFRQQALAHTENSQFRRNLSISPSPKKFGELSIKRKDLTYKNN